LQFTGTFSGNANLKFGYDPTILPPGFDEETLSLYQFKSGIWEKLTGVVEPVQNTITVTVPELSVFALGIDALSSFTVNGSTSPANSGTITGGGTYAAGSSISLVAAANAGYAFSNWTENNIVVSVSPAYTFLAQSNRTLVANFATVGSARSVATTSLPASGGSTAGDGAYALGSSATVVATPNFGYKFSKWLENGAVVSLSSSYTFTVSSNRALVAKFKPV
jgi:hypothetical protein